MGYIIVDVITLVVFSILSVVYFVGDTSEFILSFVFIGFALFFLNDLITRLEARIKKKNDKY